MRSRPQSQWAPRSPSFIRAYDRDRRRRLLARVSRRRRACAIDACGASASKASIDLYKNAGHSSIPSRGPMAANTVAARCLGWGEAFALSREYGRLPMSRLLEDAIWSAGNGFHVTVSQNDSAARQAR